MVAAALSFETYRYQIVLLLCRFLAALLVEAGTGKGILGQVLIRRCLLHGLILAVKLEITSRCARQGQVLSNLAAGCTLLLPEQPFD